ncbi:MAG: response regulator transcription factor [Chitinophagaceae bacterium]|nr:response regulator transcription factor [Chitinophagaceae bacterium]
MPSLKAIIIDDEQSSLHALKAKLHRHCPEIELMRECLSAEEGIVAIEHLHPDIVFLDVEMPRMNGFVMLQQLINKDFELIFTTAYDHYAIEAIRFSALDYLVKPIEVDELRAAVERAMRKRQQPVTNQRIENLLHNLVEGGNVIRRIAVPSQDCLQYIGIDDIIYLEADGNYTFLYLRDGQKLTVSKTLKDFEDLLPANLFIRIHHSCIINKNQVSKYLKGEGGQVVMNNGKILDVARRRKEDFLRAMDRR